MSPRYAVASFTVANDYVTIGSLRDSAPATVTIFPAGFQPTPLVPGTLPAPVPSYLALRPAGP
jgi:hypothetical protein